MVDNHKMMLHFRLAPKWGVSSLLCTITRCCLGCATSLNMKYTPSKRTENRQSPCKSVSHPGLLFCAAACCFLRETDIQRWIRSDLTMQSGALMIRIISPVKSVSQIGRPTGCDLFWDTRLQAVKANVRPLRLFYEYIGKMKTVYFEYGHLRQSNMC